MGVVSKKRARGMFVAAAMHVTLPAARQRNRYYISITTPRPGAEISIITPKPGAERAVADRVLP